MHSKSQHLISQNDINQILNPPLVHPPKQPPPLPPAAEGEVEGYDAAGFYAIALPITGPALLFGLMLVIMATGSNLDTASDGLKVVSAFAMFGALLSTCSGFLLDFILLFSRSKQERKRALIGLAIGLFFILFLAGVLRPAFAAASQ